MVRIIGGSWRGRKLRVEERPGLRPSADRTRETLFNWLQPVTPGARVLDLFAGSGALGFEALSRGAAHATLVERDPMTAQTLREHAQTLGAKDCTIACEDALHWLAHPRKQNEPDFDLAFLDPPFATDLLLRAANTLEHGGWLHAEALIYAEFDAGNEPAHWPDSWDLLRRAKSGDAACILFRRKPQDSGASP